MTSQQNRPRVTKMTGEGPNARVRNVWDVDPHAEREGGTAVITSADAIGGGTGPSTVPTMTDDDAAACVGAVMASVNCGQSMAFGRDAYPGRDDSLYGNTVAQLEDAVAKFRATGDADQFASRLRTTAQSLPDFRGLARRDLAADLEAIASYAQGADGEIECIDCVGHGEIYHAAYSPEDDTSEPCDTCSRTGFMNVSRIPEQVEDRLTYSDASRADASRLYGPMITANWPDPDTWAPSANDPWANPDAVDSTPPF